MKVQLYALTGCVLALACGNDSHSKGASGGTASTSGGAAQTNGGVATTSGGAQANAGAQASSGGRANGGAATASGGTQAHGGAATTNGGSTSGGSTSGGSTSGGTLGAAGDGGSGGAGSNGAVRLLIFSRTLGYHHESIPVGIEAFSALAPQRGWSVTASDDPARFTDAGLAAFDVVMFLSTSGDVLDDTQQLAFQRFIRAGNGFVGVHSASDTEYDWPWYGQLVGAYFLAHPAIQQASVIVENANHPATQGLTSPWTRTDEWYAFRENPRASVNVLLRLDESSYAPDTASMGSDHPIAWAHEFEGGRAFYTALGHTDASYREAAFVKHVGGAVDWAAGK